jgi:hypothetical protein
VTLLRMLVRVLKKVLRVVAVAESRRVVLPLLGVGMVPMGRVLLLAMVVAKAVAVEVTRRKGYLPLRRRLRTLLRT